MVGEAVRVTVGADCPTTTCADCVIELASLFTLGLGFNCAVIAGFASAVPTTALAAGVEEPDEQAASAQIAVHGSTQVAKRCASPAMNPAWRLIEVINNLPDRQLHGDPDGCEALDQDSGAWSALKRRSLGVSATLPTCLHSSTSLNGGS